MRTPIDHTHTHKLYIYYILNLLKIHITTTITCFGNTHHGSKTFSAMNTFKVLTLEANESIIHDKHTYMTNCLTSK